MPIFISTDAKGLHQYVKDDEAMKLSSRLAGCTPRFMAKAVGVVSLLCALTGCSKEEKKQVRFSKPAPEKSTTQTVTAGSENQTEYIVERYLSQDERLRRRQARISAVLDSPAP